MLIREQVRRAKQDAEARGESEMDEQERGLKREEGEKIKLSFGAKSAVSNSESKTIEQRRARHRLVMRLLLKLQKMRTNSLR